MSDKLVEQNTSLIDLKALSEPACKLIETVSNAVGIVAEPWRMKRNAKAENVVAKIKAEGALERVDLQERMEERLYQQEIRRQTNIEQITRGAAGFLPETVSEEKVDDDWVSQFFESCQNVSDEEMQTLWAKILAGEVAAPGRFSLRTLEFLKTMSKEEANLFVRFCSFLWRDILDNNSYCIVDGEDTVLAENGFTDASLMSLESIGLVLTSRAISLKSNSLVQLMFDGETYHFTLNDAFKPTPEIPVHLLSQIGEELSTLCQTECNKNYLDTLLHETFLPYKVTKLSQEATDATAAISTD